MEIPWLILIIICIVMIIFSLLSEPKGGTGKLLALLGLLSLLLLKHHIEQKTINSLENSCSIYENEELHKQKLPEFFTKLWNVDDDGVKYILTHAAEIVGLKMVFDFERKTVVRMDMEGSDDVGQCYPLEKLIYIGAKRDEKEVMGTIIHELGHLLQNTIHDNECLPYSKQEKFHRFDCYDLLDQYKFWKHEKKDTNKYQKDDYCGGIISNIYLQYKKKSERIEELVARIPEIVVNYDHDKSKLNFIKETYDKFFSFYDFYIVDGFEQYSNANGSIARLIPELKGLEKHLLSLL